MGFHVGQIVKCVDDRPCSLTGRRQLQCGALYTVRSFWITPLDKPAVLLDEIPWDTPNGAGSQYGWDGHRFRPLDESRLTVFRQMLVTPLSKELVDEDLDARIADCERAVREALGF
jgi:hypothetical protein